VLSNVRLSNRPFWVKHFQTILAAVSMSLTGSRFSSESAPRSLYGVFLVKKFMQSGASFHSSVSLFDLKVRSFVPMARPHLDGFEHDGAAWCCRDDAKG